MPLSVLLLGPCAPGDVSDLLCEESALRAEEFASFRGIPVSDLARGLVLAGHEVSVVTSAVGLQRSVAFDGPSLHLVVVPSRSRTRDALDLYAAERRAIGSAGAEGREGDHLERCCSTSR